jgi:hypothetical protein
MFSRFDDLVNGYTGFVEQYDPSHTKMEEITALTKMKGLDRIGRLEITLNAIGYTLSFDKIVAVWLVKGQSWLSEEAVGSPRECTRNFYYL